jgi:hypothetical protein
MGGGRRGGRPFVNLVLVKAAGRLYSSDAVRAARQEARLRLWEGARVEGGDEASPRRRCSERRSRRGLYVSRTCFTRSPGVLYSDTGATLDDLHEAVTTLEDTGRVARRVLGGAHPTTNWIEVSLRIARARLRALENTTKS